MSVKRYLIEFYKEADESIVINAGGTVRHNFPLIPEKLSAVLSEEAYESLLNNDNIKNIEEVKKGTGAAQTHHWGLIYTAVDIGYKGVFTGNGVKVAIIDTGISSHSDLPAPVGWVDYISSQATPYDDHGHGTFIAGLIAAQDNSMGYYGVAPDVDLYVAKVLDSNNAGYSDDFIAGINWAIAQGVDIINFSIYMDDWDETTVRDACRAAYNAGIVVVACSGNGTLNDFIAVNQVCAPAKDYSCVAVGSINLNGYRSSFSNYGTGLDLVAPGEGLSSTYPTNTYANWSGTSFATAMVTGHFAALKEKYPSYTRAQLVSKLLSRCDGVGSVSEYGAGCVMADIPVLAVTDPTNYGCSWSVQGLSSPWDDGNYIACAITHYGDLPYGSAYAPDPILDIQYAPSSGSNYNTPYSSFDAGLSPGTTYTLYAYCQAANGLWYPVRTSKITTLPYGVLLNTPSYVRSWKSSGRVTVFWSESMASPFAEGWQFFYKRHIDSTWTQLDTVWDASNSISCIFTGLTNGVSYDFRARAFTLYQGEYYFSDYSAITTVTPDANRPGFFSWTYAGKTDAGVPVAGSQKSTAYKIYVTAGEWNDLIDNIIAVWGYQGWSCSLSSSDYVVSGNQMLAAEFNKVRFEIGSKNSTGINSKTAGVSQILVADFNTLQEKLNEIY